MEDKFASWGCCVYALVRLLNPIFLLSSVIIISMRWLSDLPTCPVFARPKYQSKRIGMRHKLFKVEDSVSIEQVQQLLYEFFMYNSHIGEYFSNTILSSKDQKDDKDDDEDTPYM